MMLRAFLSRVSNAKYLAFDTPTSKKALPSNMVNAIIFGISEQCGLKFKTALFTNCKRYIILLFRGARFLFLLLFSFFFPSLSSTSHSCLRASNHFSAFSLSLSLYLTFCLPLRWNPGRSIKASWSLSQWFFFFFFFSLWFDGRLGSGCVGYEFGRRGHQR